MDKYLYGETRIIMAKKAKMFGIFALVSGIILFAFPIFAVAFAAFAILFAFLSKGYYPKMCKDAKHGMILGIIVFTFFVSLFGFGIYKFTTDEQIREAVYTEIDQNFGSAYEEILGMKPSDIFKEYLPGGDINE